MKYEDFLETLSEHDLDQLLSGDAVPLEARASRGYDLLAEVMNAERVEAGSGEKVWREYLDSLDTQEEAGQAYVDLSVLIVLAIEARKRLGQRFQEIHRRSCSKCQEAHKKNMESKKNLLQMLDQIREALDDEDEDDDEDPEPWKKSVDDPPEGM